MATLVTGATGLVGNNVVRQLLARGEEVRVFIRENSDHIPLDGLPVQFSHGDIRDPQAVNWAVEKTDLIVHCAAQVHIGWQGLALQRAINVEGTRNIADAALKNRVRMVHVSSIDALGAGTPDRPIDEHSTVTEEVPCPYVVTKREAEQIVLDRVAQGLDAVIVNPGFMLGPWDWKPSSGRVLLKVAKGWALVAPPGTNSYCDVRDVAAGIIAALEKGPAGDRYILAGKTLTYMEAIKIFARVTGQRPPFRIARNVTVKVIGCLGDLFGWIVGHELDVNSAASAMSMLPKNFSSAKAQSELGYRTRDIEQSAADAWAWFRQHGYAKAS
jgi:dihydroflavonol-4-reductase